MIDKLNIKTLSSVNIIWIGIVLTILAILSAFIEDFGLVAAMLLITVIFTHQYLTAPYELDEDKSRVYAKRYGVLAVVTLMMFPHLFYKMKDVGLVLEFSIPLIVLLAGNYYALKSRNFIWRSARTNVWLIAIIGSILISMIYGYTFLSVPFHPRDILSTKSTIYYFLIFNLFYQMNWNANEVRKYFLTPFIISGLVTVAIGILQYLHIPGLNETVFAYWTEEHHLDELMKPEARRIFSTYYSSGSYGAFLISLFAHIMAAYLASDLRQRISLAVSFVFTLIALFMTAAKGAFIVFLILIATFPIFFYQKLQLRIAGTIVSVAGFLIIFMIIQPAIEDTFLMQRMQSVQRTVTKLVTTFPNLRVEELVDDTSVGRVAPWVVSWPKIIASPVFGYGPGKSILPEQSFHLSEDESFKNPFESTYLEVVFGYGALGLLLNIGILIHIIYIQVVLLRNKNLPSEFHRNASAGMAFIFMMLILFWNTAAIFNMRIMFSVYASAGISASYLLALKSIQGNSSVTSSDINK